MSEGVDENVDFLFDSNKERLYWRCENSLGDWYVGGGLIIRPSGSIVASCLSRWKAIQN